MVLTVRWSLRLASQGFWITSVEMPPPFRSSAPRWEPHSLDLRPARVHTPHLTSSSRTHLPDQFPKGSTACHDGSRGSSPPSLWAAWSLSRLRRREQRPI